MTTRTQIGAFSLALMMIALPSAGSSNAETLPVGTTNEPVQAVIAPNEIAAGPFKPTDESFKQYQNHEWFRDAKFGIWAHWGPAAVSLRGDWYAKNLKRRVGRPAFIRCAHRNDRPFFRSNARTDPFPGASVENRSPRRTTTLRIRTPTLTRLRHAFEAPANAGTDRG